MKSQCRYTYNQYLLCVINSCEQEQASVQIMLRQPVQSDNRWSSESHHARMFGRVVTEVERSSKPTSNPSHT